MNDQQEDPPPSIPEVPDTGSTGEQVKAFNEGEVLPPLTNAPYSDGEFVGALAEISKIRSRGISGPDISSVVVARFRELEKEVADLKAQNTDLNAKYDSARSSGTSCDKDLAVQRTLVDHLKREGRLSSAILVIAGIVLAYAFAPDEDLFGQPDWLMIGLAALLYLIAIFGPLWFGGRK